MESRFKLTLLVTPDCSGEALTHLYKALEDLPYNDYELVIVDALKEPARAAKYSVCEMPAVVYHSMAGDVVLQKMQDYEAIRKALGIARV